MWNKRGTAEDGGYEVMTIHKPIPFGHVIYQKLKRPKGPALTVIKISNRIFVLLLRFHPVRTLYIG
jgi:hypothetical protein